MPTVEQLRQEYESTQVRSEDLEELEALCLRIFLLSASLLLDFGKSLKICFRRGRSSVCVWHKTGQPAHITFVSSMTYRRIYGVALKSVLQA